MAKFSNQQFLLQIEKKDPQDRARCMAGVDEISGMRDGWHTIPVKLLSQSSMLFKFLDGSFQV